MSRPSSSEDREVRSEPGGEVKPPGPDVIIIFIVFFEGGLAPLSLLLGWWLGHNPLEHFTWSSMDALWGALAPIPIVVTFLCILRWPVGRLSQIKAFCEDEFVPLLGGISWSDMAIIALSAGVGEEMLFRGVLQTSLASWLGWGWGLSVSSLLFGVLHPISLPYIFLMMGVGFYFGGVFLLTGNLLAVMVTHAVYDFALMAYLLKITFRGEPRDSIFPIDPDADIDDRNEA